MDKRVLDIVGLLKNSNKPLGMAFLCSQFGVSARTLRYSLNTIDEFLLKLNLAPLIRNRTGIYLNLNKNEKDTLCRYVKKQSEHYYFSNTNERITLIKLELLLADNYHTIMKLGKILKVSKSTVVNDLKVVKEQFERKNVSVSSVPRHGIRLECTELKRRILIVEVLSEALSFSDLSELMQYGGSAEHGSTLGFRPLCNYLSPEQIMDSYKLVKKMEKKLGAAFSDMSFIHILFALETVKIRQQKHGLFLDDKMHYEIENTRDYLFVRTILSKHLIQNSSTISNDEIVFITLYVLCADVFNISYYKKEKQVDVQITASKIIRNVQENLKTDRLFTDILQNNVCEYLSHAYYRIRYSIAMHFNNRCLREEEYGAIKQAVLLSIPYFETFVGDNVPEDEINGLTALFCETYLRQENSGKETFKVLVICHEGQAVCGLLSARIEYLFEEIEITATLQRHRIRLDKIRNKIDFIISTVPIEFTDCTVLMIDSSLSEGSVNLIKRYLSENKPKYTQTTQNLRHTLNQFLHIAESVCPKPVFNQLLTAVSDELGPVDYMIYPGGILMLKDMITENTIALYKKAANWEDAVRICGGLMVDSGCVEHRFVEEMVKLVKENGPYVVIAPGIAMPHARPGDGAIKCNMSIVTLDESVIFGHEDNDPVWLIIGLASTDNTIHLDALSELMDLLGNEEKLAKIKLAKTSLEVLDLI